MRNNTPRALLRRLAPDGPPATALVSEAAYRAWCSTLSNEDLERERIRLLTDDELMAELATARQEMEEDAS